MFRFKQFSIRDTNSAMKVGTDGILLSAWADISEANSILDIGSGTSLISIACAQKNAVAKITGIEIDIEAMLDARFNIENSPWKERVNVINMPLQKFEPDTEFDHIISNPPFFINSLKAQKNSGTSKTY